MLLLLFGLTAIYSEGFSKPSGTHVWKQLRAIFIGIIPFAIFYKVNIRIWLRNWRFLYIANILLLTSVYFIGHAAGGCKRWISIGPLTFQPSEFCKLITIITLCGLYCNYRSSITSFKTFMRSLVHLAIPLILVFKQPHLGASLVIVFSWIIISLYAGVPFKYIFGTCTAALMILSSAFFIPGVLKDYQKERVLAMFKNDEQGSNYQQLKGIIAIGTGGTTGKGFLHGMQKEGRFIPEQHTDFAFTIIGEEFGFIGSSMVMILFGILFFQIFRIIITTKVYHYILIASGSLAILFFHFMVNMYMNLNLAPVVGLWLPFISYGGSAIWLCLSILGMLLQIDNNKKESFF